MIFFQAADNISYLDDLIGVKADRRLIENKELGVSEECLSEADSLLVALGEIAYEFASDIGDAEQFHNSVYLVAAFTEGDAFETGTEAEVFLYLHFGVERRYLREIADILLGFYGVPGDVNSVDSDLSCGHGEVTGYHVHCGGFSGAVRAEESKYLIIVYCKAYVIDCTVGAIVFCKVFNGDHELLLSSLDTVSGTRCLKRTVASAPIRVLGSLTRGMRTKNTSFHYLRLL